MGGGGRRGGQTISIHALREEGDEQALVQLA